MISLTVSRNAGPRQPGSRPVRPALLLALPPARARPVRAVLAGPALAVGLALAISAAGGPVRATEPGPASGPGESSAGVSRPGAAQEATSEATSEATWEAIRGDVFPGRTLVAAGGVVALTAPARAEDAAIVPVTVRAALPEGDGRTLKTITLVVDENPAPVAGTFALGEGQRAFTLQLRVRVNSYSYVRAVVETSDGALHMTKAYVKASGGCSAPATKDPAEAAAHVGEIRFRIFADAGRGQVQVPEAQVPEAQVQVRHPNASGLQMDPLTRAYAPAWFVRELTVKQGAHTVFAMTGGISISEDPTFRFSYGPSAEPVTVEAEDTEGRIFRRSFPGGGS